MAIPKIINYCWFGYGKKSKMVKRCISSWRKFAPDYKIVEWNENNFDIKINKYVKEAYENRKWAFVSDYARLWIIYNNGGIYFDTDVELIKPIDEEILNYKGFYCMENDKIATGLGFGAEKEDKIVKKLLDSYNNINIKFDNETTCVRLNEPIFESEFKAINKEKINIQNNYIILPTEYFCPLNYITGEMEITKNTIGIHWYNASWYTKKEKAGKRIKQIKRKIIGNENFEKIKKIKNRK